MAVRDNLFSDNITLPLSFISFVPILFFLLVLQGCDHQPTSSRNLDAEHSHPKNITQVDAINTDTVKVVSPDWGNAATLTAMGFPPIATGDIRVWHRWVGKPELPDTVQDLGIRYLPNAELVAQLPVDLVIDNYFYAHARHLYNDTPAESVLFFSEGRVSTWEDYVRPTQQLGRLIKQPEAAKAYITDSRTQIEQAGQQLRQRYPKVSKFAVVQFVDANNMRMYSYNSLFNVMLSILDYDLVALDDGNEWGFISIQLGDLAKLDDDVCLLVIEPLSPLIEEQLQQSLVWQRLDYGRLTVTGVNQNIKTHSQRCSAKLDPVWIYGGMSSLTTLAQNLAASKLTGGVAE